MSKKFSLKEKKRWLGLFEEGQTESQIAKSLRHDLRTVVKGIQEAARDRNLAHADTEMLRNALSNHQNQLMGVLKDIASMLVLPDYNLQLREEENGNLAPTPLLGLLIEQTPEKEITLTILAKEKLEWELLQEHLKSDKLWGYLKRWGQAITGHIGARWQFRQAIKSSLKRRTHLEFKGRGGEPPEYLSPEAIELLYGVAMNQMLGIKDATNLENNIVVDGEFVRHGQGGTELARCKNAEECRNKIISVFTSLPKTPAGVSVRDTYAELSPITRAARRQVDEILLLGMVTGKCRVCARLSR